MENNKKYLKLLAQKYPTKQAVSSEIINLSAICNLPKGTEHFMSDIHGEYEAFCHILNNCSGVIHEKVDLLFRDTLSNVERQEICTLIYYPKEKLEMLHKECELPEEWYRMMLGNLIEVAKLLSSKYTRSKVRKAMPKEFAYIIDELLHVQKDEDDNQVRYHKVILDTILNIHNGDEFIIALANLIKRLAVDHLHIVGDIFDRGPCADMILDLLMEHHSLDIEWGNHDILWMGAACGNKASIANVIRNNLKYNNTRILENGYGISLRNLALFGEKTYKDKEPMDAALKAISVILFKLEEQIICRHPEYEMNERLLLSKINLNDFTIKTADSDLNNKNTITANTYIKNNYNKNDTDTVSDSNGNSDCNPTELLYKLSDTDLPTINPDNPLALTEQENAIMDELQAAFIGSNRLQKHIKFLYEKGSMYKIFNNNLLYHGCVPLDEYGNFDGITLDGVVYQGKKYLDYADKMARLAYLDKDNENALDFMWFLWAGHKSPLCGRVIKTFERSMINDENTWHEPTNPYYRFYHTEKTCNMILHEFGLFSPESHIINGHTPVKTIEGESPIRANGKLLVIDGGFSKAYHETTGIAGYTLIFNSHGMRIKAHHPFESVYKALRDNKDIDSESEIVYTASPRILVKDTENGKQIRDEISDLKMLLNSDAVN